MNQLRNGRFIETRIIETNKRNYFSNEEIEMLIEIEKREGVKILLDKYLSLSTEERMEIDIENHLDGFSSIEKHIKRVLGGK